jgi:hypothetical protein
MVTIAANVLPTPHSASLRDESITRRSAAGRMPFFQKPDPTLKPRRFALAWQRVPAAVGDAITRHYDEHTHEVWQLRLPRTGEVVLVLWTSPPSRQRGPAPTVSITAEVLEVLAHE